MFWRNGLFVTGPESAGAVPGPACYRKGGPLAVTDANLLLGRLVPDHFPKIFGPNEDEPLDENATKSAFEQLAKEINADVGKALSLDEIAWGFLKIANETMCRPIRALTEARGYSTAKHVLTIFGGAGGQHACALAATLGITRVLIHRYSSILSAYGMALSDRVVEKQEPSSEKFSKDSEPRLLKKLDGLTEDAKKALKSQGFADKRIKVEKYLNLRCVPPSSDWSCPAYAARRYDGTDTALMILQEDVKDFDYASAFEKSYKQEFGFVLSDRDLIVDDVRVRGIGKSFDSLGKSVWQEVKDTTFKPVDAKDESRRDRTMKVYFDGHGRLDVPVFLLGNLDTGSAVQGPALILDGALRSSPICKSLLILLPRGCRRHADVGHRPGRHSQHFAEARVHRDAEKQQQQRMTLQCSSCQNASSRRATRTEMRANETRLQQSFAVVRRDFLAFRTRARRHTSACCTVCHSQPSCLSHRDSLLEQLTPRHRYWGNGLQRANRASGGSGGDRSS